MDLLVIKACEARFGCPHCGCIRTIDYINMGNLSFCSCKDCTREYIMVENSINDVLSFNIRNTNLKNLIGKHPYQNRNSDCMISFKHLPKEMSYVRPINLSN